MLTEIHKGENKLIEYELANSEGVGIPFADLIECTVTLSDYSGNTVAKTKTGSTVVEGSTTTSIEFEITETDLDSFDVGLIKAKTTIQTSDTDFTSNQAVQVRSDELLLGND